MNNELLFNVTCFSFSIFNYHKLKRYINEIYLNYFLSKIKGENFLLS